MPDLQLKNISQISWINLSFLEIKIINLRSKSKRKTEKSQSFKKD